MTKDQRYESYVACAGPVWLNGGSTQLIRFDLGSILVEISTGSSFSCFDFTHTLSTLFWFAFSSSSVFFGYWALYERLLDTLQ